MLDDFGKEQEIVYKVIKNALNSNKLSHAYIIETNQNNKGFEFARAFAKSLLCPNKYTGSSECGQCKQCAKIDNNDYIEIKILEAETQWIKKAQLEELQEEFSKKAIIGTTKIYIIKNAEKLNESSENALLKFLEEPLEGIVAILITPNKEQLLDTVISRCQVLSLKKSIDKTESFETKLRAILRNSSLNSKVDIETMDIYEKTDRVIDFVKNYEENNTKTLIYINKLWNNCFKERNDLLIAFTIMLCFYKDVLNYKLNRDFDLFTDYKSSIEYVGEKNSSKKIINKINVIINLRDKIKYNANANLLMDKLIIELEGSDESDRSSRCDI